MNSQAIEKMWYPIKAFPSRTVQYFKEVRQELQRVSWPSRKEVVGTTIVVVISVFFFGFYLYVVDILLNTGLNRLYKFFGQ